jgi:translation elongation factor EF-1alpha
MAEQPPPVAEEQIGKVTHFFSKISVGIIELSAPLRVGETIHIKGHTTDFTQTVGSMQVEHEQVDEAKPGDAIGIKVDDHVREGDVVYRVG